MIYLLKFKYLYFFVMISFCFLGRSSEVEANQVFKIENIEVDETSQTAIAAREKALEIGQKKAWELLFRRVTLPDENSQMVELSLDEIKGLVQGYEVVRERISPVRYLANLTVIFNPKLVREILFQNGVTFSETPSLPMLLIPVFETNGVSRLWKRPNPWMNVWRESFYDNSFIPLIIPEGDFQDIKYLSAEQAISGELIHFNSIMKKYRVQKIIVAKVSKKFDLVDNSPFLEIAIRASGHGDFEETIIDIIKIPPDTDVNDLMYSGKQKTIRSLNVAWKRQNQVVSGVHQRISVEIPILGLEHWLSIRSKLREIGTLKTSELVSLTKERALVEFWIMGTLKQLDNALQYRRLALFENNDLLILCELSDRMPKLCDGIKSNKK
tara:strand:- start:398 stop:1546 length:1149 start_codon:yes stop_codon:yes gene_type:complete